MILKKKHKVEKKVELEINMERMGSKIIELHKISKKFKDHVILNDLHLIFSVVNVWNYR
jgi:ATP-binding cassette subfamily F protein uup